MAVLCFGRNNMFLPSSRYFLTVLQVYFDRARCMFQRCSRCVSTVIDQTTVLASCYEFLCLTYDSTQIHVSTIIFWSSSDIKLGFERQKSGEPLDLSDTMQFNYLGDAPLRCVFPCDNNSSSSLFSRRDNDCFVKHSTSSLETRYDIGSLVAEE